MFKHGNVKISGETFIESEQGFRSLVENAASPIAVANLRGRLIYVNRALADLTGYSVEELLGAPFRDFLHPDDRAKVTRLFLKAIVLRRRLRYLDFRIVRKDGRVLYLMSKPTSFAFQGRKTCFQAIIVDITERKEIEKKLEETNRKLQLIFETALEGITIVDPKENITFANAAFAEMMGYRIGELTGSNLRRLVDEKGFGEIRKQTENRKKGRVSRYEVVLYRKDGDRRLVQVSASPMWNEEGDFVGTLAIVMDITERKNVEEGLRESEEKFRSLFEKANDAFVLVGLSGRILDLNRSAAELAGMRKEEILGKSFLKLRLVSLRNVPMLLNRLRSNSQGKTITGFELEIRRKDGDKRFIEVNSTLIRKKGMPVCYLAIVRDITERRHMQRKLEEYAQQLEEMVEKRTKQLRETQEQLIKSERLAAIGQVAAMVGHDLRNPLTGINGATYYLKMKLGPRSGKKTRQMLDLIERDIQYSNKIITDLLEYSKESNLEPVETTPRSIVEEAISSVIFPRNIKVTNLTKDEPKMTIDAEKMKSSPEFGQ
jgi:PAS domain S-box-containing protein